MLWPCKPINVLHGDLPGRSISQLPLPVNAVYGLMETETYFFNFEDIIQLT